jgi:adenylate kinase family enzyme
MDLKIPTLESIKRLSARGKTEKGRSYDKNTDLIVRRLEEFEKSTVPVIEYYRKIDKTMTIDANGPRDDVFHRLSESADKAFKHIR